MKIADTQKGFNEGDTCVTCSYYNDSAVLYYLRLTKKSFGSEAESEWAFFLIKRISIVTIYLELILLLILLFS